MENKDGFKLCTQYISVICITRMLIYLYIKSNLKLAVLN